MASSPEMSFLVRGDEFSGEGRSAAAVRDMMERVRSGDAEAAREIRRLTKTSSRHRRMLAGAIEPLVSMLRSGGADGCEAALLALLNLAVKDDRNKIKIVEAGALDPLLHFLQLSDSNLQEYATAAILTLSASSINKPIISSIGAIPLLVNILRDRNAQAKTDAVRALYNLSTLPDNPKKISSCRPIPALVNLLKIGKKSARIGEYCSALLESLLDFDEGRTALTDEKGGVLAVVEVLEDGSLQSREHAVGALLKLCESDRCKYREIILNEGVIPGLLDLTVHGTPKSQSKARKLLQLLRDSAYPRPELQPDTLENIVSKIVSRIDGGERAEKARKMLDEMVQVSMEQSLRHLQRRALVCTPTEPPIRNRPSEVPSK